MQQLRDILILMPARGGSQRLPRKNIRPLLGRSLVERALDTINASGITASVLLSTDDPEIAEHGRQLGLLVPFLRPAHLASDTATTEAVVLHALDWFRTANGQDMEFVLVLQITSPLRPADSLTTALGRLRSSPDHDAIIGVKSLHIPAKVIFENKGDGSLYPAMANDDRRRFFVPNGALYLTRTAAFRRFQSLTPPRTLPLVMDEIASIDIDTDSDWRLAEAALGAGLIGAVL